MDWMLISEIILGLRELEDKHNWSLDMGEMSTMAESFYLDIKSWNPKTTDDWRKIFENAYIVTWGVDHKNDAVTNDELLTFLNFIHDGKEYLKHYKELQ